MAPTHRRRTEGDVRDRPALPGFDPAATLAELGREWAWALGPDFEFIHLPGEVAQTYALEGGLASLAEGAAPIMEAMRRGRGFDNVVVVCGDRAGGRRHLRLTGRPVFGPDRLLAGYRGIARDVTREVVDRREAALKYDRLVRVFDRLDVALGVYDAEDRLVLCNSRYREFHDTIADLLQPGTSFETLLRALAVRGEMEPGERDAYLVDRLAKHRKPGMVDERRQANGRWLQTRQAVTPDGWLILAQTDVTDTRIRETGTRDIAAVADVYWEVDADMRITRLSMSADPGVTQERAALIGKTGAEVGIMAEPETFAAATAAVGARQPLRDLHFWYIDRNGRRQDFLVNGRPILDGAGRFKGYRGLASDISGQVRAERALQASHQFLQDIVDMMPVAFAQYDAQGRLVRTNARLFEFFPQLVDRVRPGDAFEHVAEVLVEQAGLAPSKRPAMLEKLRRLRDSRKRAQIQFPDGRWFDMSYHPARDGGTVGVTVDISVPKRAEIQLRDAIDALSGSFAIFDRDDRLLLANEHFWNHYDDPAVRPGIGLCELLDLDAARGRFADSDDLPPRERILAARRCHGTVQVEMADGSWTELVFHPTSEGGSVCYAIDITHHKQAESILRDAWAHAERASLEKAHFLARVTHALHTPLNAVVGFADMISQQVFGPLGNPRYEEYARFIRDGGLDLSAHINRVLELARIEIGDAALFESEIDLSELARRQLAIHGDRAAALGLDLDGRIDPGLRLCGDAERLDQLLHHLLASAAESAGTPGALRFRVARSADEGIEVRVEHAGRGLSAETLEAALQPLDPTSSVFTHSGSGLELSLPFARAVAEMHGGSLAVDSAPGQGIRVTVHLPASRRLA